ncbi:hypothetical protein DFA_08382 [Cavenderia fasciculata]|uniref:Ankyrin repeat-containing protein n=1 Tax=Cavenderia fasciculata TaxID=261658 RepID=F4Q5X8_CACFS|nr:uncharacterized protein DFA_08382 [Cavenderia fasciculata]EGG17387.1 hypothetical protein DFA_08382 [Cavenderia fasciculata]|eukprot:XP_004355871.1 hypothetical protein DFA_08382 [Cavenderia fasciculata]
MTLSKEELATLMLKNRYLLCKILWHRDNTILKGEAFLQRMSQPLHVMAAKGDFEGVRFSLVTFYSIHVEMLSRILAHLASNFYNSIYPIRPIDAAACANRLDIVKFIHRLFTSKGVHYFKFLVSVESTYQAARHLNLELLKYLLDSSLAIEWNTQTIINIIDGAAQDKDKENRAIEMFDYLKSCKTTKIAWFKTTASSGHLPMTILALFIEQLIRVVRIGHTAIHLAIKKGNKDILSMLLDENTKDSILPIDHNGEIEVIYSAVCSNNMDIIDMVLSFDLYKNDTIETSKKTSQYAISIPFLPDTELSDEMIAFVLSPKCPFTDSVRFNLDIYINRSRIGTVEHLLAMEKAIKVFNPTELVERGDLKTLTHLLQDLNLKVSQQVSIVSTIKTINFEMIEFVLAKKLIKQDGNHQDREYKQNQLAIRLLWKNTMTRKETGSSSDLSLNCLKYFFEKKIIAKEHLVNALIYWDGDQTLFTKIPAYDGFIKNLPKNMETVIRSKFNNIEAPHLTNVQEFPTNFKNRPHFKQGVQTLIRKTPDQTFCGNMACGTGDIDLIKEIDAMKLKYVQFTEDSLRLCSLFNKDLDVLKYLEKEKFQGTLPKIDANILIAAPCLPLHQMIDTYPHLFENALTPEAFLYAIKSKQYDTILYFVKNVQALTFPTYILLASCPIHPINF